MISTRQPGSSIPAFPTTKGTHDVDEYQKDLIGRVND